MGDDSNASFYQGEYSSLNPDYGNFVGYRLDAPNIGFPGSAQTANQLNETVNALKQGVKSFEVTMVSPEVAEQIPMQHFQEMKALMKLSGVKPSVHAPILDPAGFGQRGWDGEEGRQDTERRFEAVLEKAHELDADGNIPVVFHSTGGVPGPEYRPGDEEKGEHRFKEKQIILINKESNQMVPVKEERKYYPEDYQTLKPGEDLEKQGHLLTTQKQIDSVNLSDWDQKLTNLAFYKKEADETLSKAAEAGAFDLLQGKENIPEEIKQNAGKYLDRAGLFIENVDLSFRTREDNNLCMVWTRL